MLYLKRVLPSTPVVTLSLNLTPTKTCATSGSSPSFNDA